MIKEKKGDLLDEKTYYLAHQVNCKGVMGAGVALQIKRNLLDRESAGIQGFRIYQNLCNTKAPAKLLGTNNYIVLKDRVIVNMFAEDIPTGIRVDTDYQALQHCLMALRKKMEERQVDAAIPGYLGCGLAGGNWDYVFTRLIKPIFTTCRQTLWIVYREDSIKKLWTEFKAVPSKAWIKEPWHGFPTFTDTFFIWRWFEETFDLDIRRDILEEDDDISPCFS